MKTKWPAILWSVFVFVLLALPVSFFSQEKKLSVSNLDKIVHILLFAFLVFLWGYYLSYTANTKAQFKKLLAAVILLAVAYGIALEYVQLFTGRDFDVWDMVADAIGAVAGALATISIKKPG